MLGVLPQKRLAMSLLMPSPEPVSPSSLDALLQCQQQAFARDLLPSRAERDERLARLDQMLEAWGARLCQAAAADFGERCDALTQLADLLPVRVAIRHARRHLGRWMRPRRAAVHWLFLPARSQVCYQPLGVIGIIGAWNYPLQLLLAPLVDVLAAGNRAMLKPSELAPHCAAALQQAVGEFFGTAEIAVVTGDQEVAARFATLPFDHLVFTGSTTVGRQVAAAAAAQLTPLTLELGGKSPAIIDASADIALCARRLVWGKLFNAGQSCVAPDYVLVARPLLPALILALQEAAAAQYPDGVGSTSIINEQHFARLQHLLQDACNRGARALPLCAPGRGLRQMVPQLLLDVDDSMAVMQQEIFGPLLPLRVYDTPEEALAYINARPRPLALYWFGRDRVRQRQVLRGTLAGGVSINDTLLHLVQGQLPFGGVGTSGYGHYHGEHGFRRFSLHKAVFVQSTLSSMRLLYPPYGLGARRLLSCLLRWA